LWQKAPRLWALVWWRARRGAMFAMPASRVRKEAPGLLEHSASASDFRWHYSGIAAGRQASRWRRMVPNLLDGASECGSLHPPHMRACAAPSLRRGHGSERSHGRAPADI
jgi:hypothetical protein